MESRDPIFFTGTRAHSWVSGNVRLFPCGSEFGPKPEIPASPVIQLRPQPDHGCWCPGDARIQRISNHSSRPPRTWLPCTTGTSDFLMTTFMCRLRNHDVYNSYNCLSKYLHSHSTLVNPLSLTHYGLPKLQATTPWTFYHWTSKGISWLICHR